MKKKVNWVDFIRVIGKILYGLIIVTLVLVAGAMAISTFDIPGNYKLLTVQSGSMEPSIKMGSIVIIQPSADYKTGDVITVSEPTNPKVSLTHRISEVKESDGETFYVTKGDANNEPDLEERPKENVVGKVIISIPYVGYPISFAKTRDGLIILVIIPATMIVYSELLNIKNEAQKLLKERKKKLTFKEKVELEIGEEEIAAEKGIKKLWQKLIGKKKK